MTVLEYAQKLGEAIAEDEVIKNLNDAKKAYEDNLELQHFMFEYNTQRSILGAEYQKDISEQNESLINLVKEKIDELYNAIVTHEDYLSYVEAQQAVNKLMNDVNSEISFYAFGERPCTHDCSSCSSNCGQKK